MDKDYSKLSKEDLIKIVEKMESRKKYGLIWDEEKVKEQFEKDAENALPVLKEVKGKEIINKNDGPVNILIEGDNYHALSVLNFTHQGKIDVIYIDPPYNTGNKDFKYNDQYVDKEDSYSHSKWISFINKRLRLSKNLLKETGVILVSIDDNELAQLKLLMNEIFGEDNFVANIIWRGGKRNASKYISISHDYIVCFTKNFSEVSKSDTQWRIKKSGLDEIYRTYERLKKEYGKEYEIISNKLKEWYKILHADNPSKDHEHYCWVDSKGIYFASDISRGGGGGPMWKIKNPETGQYVKTPSRGWGFSSLKLLNDALAQGRIHFNNDSVPCYKRYLVENEDAILDTIFYKDRRAASIKLRDILGNNSFDFPKDHDVIAYFIKAFSPDNGIILDYFAGSGTTGHSVLELNKIGGSRKFLLVTNDEGEICSKVCYPRLKKIMQGYEGVITKKKVTGLGGNLKYFKTKFVKNASNKDDFKIRITKECAEMLCLREGIFDETRKTEDYRIFQQDNKTLAVYYSLDRKALSDLKKELNKIGGDKIFYCFTLDPLGLDKGDFDGWNNVSLEPIPQKILDVYKQIYEY